MSTCMKVSRDQSRIPELDGLRGLAISLVLIEHFVPYSIVPGKSGLADFLQRNVTLGWSGVDLFFVLSGFLIGGILMDNRDSENYFKSFYVRRCCRILPPYLLVIGAYVFFKFLLAAYSTQPWFGELFLQGGLPLWANLTFTQNYVQNLTHHYNPDWLNVNWSLAIEEQFYLVLPLALWLFRPSQLVKAILVVVCLNPLLQLYLCIFHPLGYFVISNLFPIRGHALLIGVICAYLLRQEKARAWITHNLAHFYVLFAVFFAGVIYIAPRYHFGYFEFERILLFNLWLALFYACLLLLAVVNKNGPIAFAMRFAPLRKLGTISYGVYLFHMPINGLMHGLILGRDRRYRELSDVFVAVGSLVVIVIFTSLMWRFLEKPIVTWGHTFSYNPRKSSDK